MCHVSPRDGFHLSKCFSNVLPVCLQMIAISMDVFTDVDIFKEVITSTLRGVAVYILLDESHFDSFLSMTHRAGVNIHDLKVRTTQTERKQFPDKLTTAEAVLTQTILYNLIFFFTFFPWASFKTFEAFKFNAISLTSGSACCYFHGERSETDTDEGRDFIQSAALISSTRFLPQYL